MKLQRSGRSKALALGALAIVSSLTLAACGSDENSSPSDDSSPASGTAASINCGTDGQLLGNGSSAQKNAMDVWVKNYQAACSGTTINYKAEGSGAGVQNFLQGKVAFAGSDAALKPEEMEQSKSVCKGGQGIDLPMVAGPVAIVYNLPGVDDLVLDAKTLAQIFDSKITKWNDPAIKALNPNATLPSTPIQAFHRSDDSGTTKNFTEYLEKASGGAWTHPSDKKWAGKGGQSANGSAGVSGQVKQSSGTISYVEISYATDQQLGTVKINTGASQPVAASVDAASKAIAEAKVIGTGSDLSLEVAFNTKAEGAYPISLVTYEIVCDKGNKTDTLESVKAFLTYTASEEGQKVLPDAGYAPLPDAIIQKVRDALPNLS